MDEQRTSTTPERSGTARSGADWEGFVTEEELSAFATAAASQKEVSHERRTSQIFRQNAALAAAEICELALGAANERVRLDASKYVVDRVLGRVSEPKGIEGDGAPWEGVYGAVMREPTAAERSAGKQIQRRVPNED